MNKLELENKVTNINTDKDIYLYTSDDSNRVINIESNVKLTVYHYNVDCSSNIVVNLNSEGSEIEYHYSTINYKDNSLKIEINHNKKNTTSNIYNHGVNILDNKLHFEVKGIVPKDITGCCCNQENQIINLENGNSTILPILLIENYDISSSHSAYIGKFSNDILFYLMSRGISMDNSIKLLINSLLINSGTDSEELDKFRLEIKNI